MIDDGESCFPLCSRQACVSLFGHIYFFSTIGIKCFVVADDVKIGSFPGCCP